MGSIREELRRFERRRLRPLFRRFKRRPDAPTIAAPPSPAVPTGDDQEELLIALARAELRRRSGGHDAVSASLMPPPGAGGDAERLVRSLLLARRDSATADEARNEAA